MDIVGIKLLESLGGRRCPVCRMLEKFEESEIETILYEHVTDPEVRVKFRESLGLCTRHAWKTLEIAKRKPLLGPLGVSIIYEDVLRTYLNGGGGTSECFLCELLGEKEGDIVDAMADRIGEILPEYEKSKAILCRRHYSMLLKRLDEKWKGKLEGIQRRKLEELDSRLRSFIETFDYRSTRGPTKEETNALWEAVEFLKGRPVVETLKTERRREKRWSFGLK
jgi:hypothetical protein